MLKVVTYKQLYALIASDEYSDLHRAEHVAEAVRNLIKYKLVEKGGRTSTINAAKPGGPAAAAKKPGGKGGPGEEIFGLTPAGRRPVLAVEPARSHLRLARGRSGDVSTGFWMGGAVGDSAPVSPVLPPLLVAIRLWSG
ncbi:hypothetical protein [Kitasatospora griseola]|uniref:hypothetical protein n=1 Tax=Kitasatospora griseola TaxID=2064 RepID=UPI003809F072